MGSSKNYYKDAELMEGDGNIGILIPLHHTAALQPCDLQSIEGYVKTNCYTIVKAEWWIVYSGRKMASPNGVEIADWLRKIWGKFPSENVRNAFQGCAYVYEQGDCYGMEMENKSEIHSNE